MPNNNNNNVTLNSRICTIMAHLAMHGRAKAVPIKYRSSYMALACTPGQMNFSTNSLLWSNITTLQRGPEAFIICFSGSNEEMPFKERETHLLSPKVSGFLTGCFEVLILTNIGLQVIRAIIKFSDKDLMSACVGLKGQMGRHWQRGMKHLRWMHKMLKMSPRNYQKGRNVKNSWDSPWMQWHRIPSPSARPKCTMCLSHRCMPEQLSLRPWC